MDTVKYEGDPRATYEDLGTAFLYRTNSSGDVQMFDSKAREWVDLEKGDTIVNSEEGYYLGNKKGTPKKVAEGAVQKSAFDTTPSSNPEAYGGVITSGDV